MVTGIRHTAVLVLGCALLAVALAACVESTAQGNEITSDVVPQGYAAYRNVLHGFAISVPETWVVGTDEELQATQQQILSAARSYGPKEVQELPDSATELVFLADNGVRGPGRDEVIVYINRTRTGPFRGPASPAFQALKGYRLYEERLGKISGKDAGIHDYEMDQMPPWSGVQRLVVLSVQFFDVMCPAFRFREAGPEGSVADPDMAVTCWDILRTFQLGD